MSGAATKSFTYGNAQWLDLLTAYNGNSITYDAIGNPTRYHDGATMSWQHGRQLATYAKSGATTSYTYNVDGIRTSKTVGGVRHDYLLNGMQIIADVTPNDTLVFAYDKNGTPTMFYHDGTAYYYITNQQGDVMEIRNASGTVVGTYEYNAFGEILNESSLTTIAQLNPIRYRGYYYDTESGFYYLFEAEANELGGSTLSQSWKPKLPQGGYDSYWDLIKLFFT